jgi:hypothetical protein
LDRNNTAAGNLNLANYHLDLARIQMNTDTKKEHLSLAKSFLKEHLSLAKSFLKEAIRIYMTLFGSAHPQTVKVISNLSNIESQLLEA